LLVRRLRNIREVNSSMWSRTPPFPSGSRASH
jgi:hypothetical protein